MASKDSRDWDPGWGVGLTATEAAAARAVAGRSASRLVDDPFAELLVRAVGVSKFTRLVEDADGYGNSGFALPRMVDWVAARTRFFDEFFMAADSVGIRQAVILGAGLDSRAYRLPWSPSTIVYEVDQPGVIGFKAEAMARFQANPLTRRRTVATDLRSDWRALLCGCGFDPDLPTAWVAEGLLPYLPPGGQDQLLNHVAALSPAGSWLAADTVDDMEQLAARIAKPGENVWLSEHASGSREGNADSPPTSIDLSARLRALDWESTVFPAAELFAEYGVSALAPEDEELYRKITFLSAWRGPLPRSTGDI